MPEGSSVTLFAADAAGLFAPGSAFTLTATFADGSSASASTTIAAGPPALTLAFAGVAADRVGRGNASLGPDGVLDGTFTLALAPGPHPHRHPARPAPHEQLRDLGHHPRQLLWLRRRPLPDQRPGQRLQRHRPLPLARRQQRHPVRRRRRRPLRPRLRLHHGHLRHGSSASASTTIAAGPPALTLAFAGVAADRVGRGNASLGPDGVLDGTFTLALAPGSGTRTVTQLDLRRMNNSGIWDTIPGSSFWALGAAPSRTSALHNASNGTVRFPLPEGSSVTLFAADAAGLFAPGSAFTLTATFADGSSASASTTIAAGPPALTLAFAGVAADRVGRGNASLGPDGVLDGTFTLALAPGSGTRTVTQLDLRRMNNSGIWDTIPGSSFGPSAPPPPGPAPCTTPPTAPSRSPLPEGSSVTLFAADAAGLFAPGSAFTPTATFADGSSASASTAHRPLTWTAREARRATAGHDRQVAAGRPMPVDGQAIAAALIRESERQAESIEDAEGQGRRVEGRIRRRPRSG